MQRSILALVGGALVALLPSADAFLAPAPALRAARAPSGLRYGLCVMWLNLSSVRRELCVFVSEVCVCISLTRSLCSYVCVHMRKCVNVYLCMCVRV